MIKKIAEDTQTKNKLIRKNKILSLIIIIIIGGIITFQNMRQQEIDNPEQILSVSRSNESIKITTDIPAYKSIVGYYVDNDIDDTNTIRISLVTDIDFSMKNKKDITLNLDKTFLDKEIKKVEIVDKNSETIKTFTL